VITKVFIIPAAGHSDDDGNYSLGHSIGRECELRVVDRYLASMEEVLGEYGLPFEVLDTRTKPGFKTSDRPSQIPPNCIVIDIGVGWFSGSRVRNASSVFYSTKESVKLADLVAQNLCEWGRCANFEHSSGSPKHKDIPNLKGQIGVRIEPFAINGPRADDYFKRLGNLGIDIASAVVEYVKSVNPAIGYRPYVAVPRYHSK